MTLLSTLAAFVVGYFLGSIPFGLLVARFGGAGDVRTIGSGNIGATNVLRTGRKDLAAATLFLDALKGFIAVVVVVLVWGELAPNPASLDDAAREAMSDRGFYAAGAAAIGAMLGHCFPMWLRFKGGKGVATFLGVLLGLFPLGALCFALIWLVSAYMTRYSSLAALLAVGASPVVAWMMGGGFVGLTLLVMAAIVFYRHTENIARLRAGTERRIGDAA